MLDYATVHCVIFSPGFQRVIIRIGTRRRKIEENKEDKKKILIEAKEFEQSKREE